MSKGMERKKEGKKKPTKTLEEKRAAKKAPLLISGITGAGVKDALRALVEVIGEAPVSIKAKGAAQTEPWAPTTPQG